MKPSYIVSLVIGVGMFFALPAVVPAKAQAHCDTAGGPVVSAARMSLKTGNPNFMLIWVKKEDEDEVLREFEEAKKRKKLTGTDDDTRLYEALVRIHRKGEGASYEGLKPATALEPELAAADRALEEQNVSLLIPFISEDKQPQIHNLLREAITLKTFHPDDLTAGRAYVASYVRYIHSVERAAKGMPFNDAGIAHHHGHR